MQIQTLRTSAQNVSLLINKCYIKDSRCARTCAPNSHKSPYHDNYQYTACMELEMYEAVDRLGYRKRCL